jgi:AAA domain-containing protein
MQLTVVQEIRNADQIERIVGEDCLLMTQPMREYMKALDTASRLPDWHRFAIFYGESGSGKSSGARLFCQRNPSTIYIIAPPKYHDGKAAPNKLMGAIAKSKGLDGRYDAFDRCCEGFAREQAFVIIDEAHTVCQYLTLHYLKQFVERCPGVRIALVGKAPELPFWMNDPKCSEIRRRARIYKEIRNPSVEDLQEGFPVLRPDVIELLHRICGGNMSTITMRIHDLLDADIKGKNGEKVSPRLLGVATVENFAEAYWGYNPATKMEPSEVMRRRK